MTGIPKAIRRVAAFAAALALLSPFVGMPTPAVAEEAGDLPMNFQANVMVVTGQPGGPRSSLLEIRLREWTTEEERASNRAEASITCHLMMKAGRNFLDQEQERVLGYCSRGLEHKTPVGFRQRQARKVAARTAVLSEQAYQRASGSDDCVTEEQIASAYEKHSAVRQEAAHLVGLSDEQIAYALHQEEEIETPSKASIPKTVSGIPSAAKSPASALESQNAHIIPAAA